MERLISSPFLPKLSGLLPTGSSAGRSAYPLLRRTPPATTTTTTTTSSSSSSSSNQHKFPLRVSSSPLLLLRHRQENNKSKPILQTVLGTHPAPSQLLPKVASSVAVVLLSALTITLILPIFAPSANATTVQSAATSGGLIKSELLNSAWTGFFAGCLHTLSGPDHLAALAPLSIGRTSIESAAVGALWGCGHDAGQMIFGLLFLLLKDRLHIEVIRTWGTRVVGLTLLVIGSMGIKEASEVPTPCVTLENGECDVSITESLGTAPNGKKKIGFATFATGIVHGLQPDALMMVLPALALPSRLAGAAFLGMFLVGTVLAMGSYTVFIGSCSQALKERIPRITEKLTWAASLLAISMGIAILISQFFGFSLY